MKCRVCGYDLKEEGQQCRKCGSLNRKMPLARVINIFARLNDLELQNQKQAAVIMKLWKEVQSLKTPPSLVCESGIKKTVEEIIDEVLQL